MKINVCKDLPEISMGGNVTRKLLAYQEGENGYTVNYLKAKAGDTAPLHSHPHLQVVYMMEGEGVFHVGEETMTLTPGDVVQIDSNVPHTFDSFSKDSIWLEFFTPVREDFLPGK